MDLPDTGGRSIPTGWITPTLHWKWIPLTPNKLVFSRQQWWWQSLDVAENSPPTAGTMWKICTTTNCHQGNGSRSTNELWRDPWRAFSGIGKLHGNWNMMELAQTTAAGMNRPHPTHPLLEGKTDALLWWSFHSAQQWLHQSAHYQPSLTADLPFTSINSIAAIPSEKWIQNGSKLLLLVLRVSTHPHWQLHPLKEPAPLQLPLQWLCIPLSQITLLLQLYPFWCFICHRDSHTVAGISAAIDLVDHLTIPWKAPLESSPPIANQTLRLRSILSLFTLPMWQMLRSSVVELHREKTWPNNVEIHVLQQQPQGSGQLQQGEGYVCTIPLCPAEEDARNQDAGRPLVTQYWTRINLKRWHQKCLVPEIQCDCKPNIQRSQVIQVMSQWCAHQVSHYAALNVESHKLYPSSEI